MEVRREARYGRWLTRSKAAGFVVVEEDGDGVDVIVGEGSSLARINSKMAAGDFVGKNCLLRRFF